MLNNHEILMLIIVQIAMIFMVQNIFPVYATYGQYLNKNDTYILDARNKSTPSFYRFSQYQNFYSTHSELISDKKDVDVFWWKHITTIQQVGIFVGSVSFGYISDHFGRKTVCKYSLLFSSVVLGVEGFLSNPILFAISRFIIGTQTGAMMIVSWSLVAELISPKTRFLARAFSNWPNGKLALALICLCSQNWRIALHVCSVLTFIGALLYIFFVPESPTWLHCHGQRENAEAVVANVFKKSKGQCIIVLPTGIRTKTLTFSQIWQKEKYRNVIILFGAIWMMTNFTATMLDFSESVILNDSLLYSQLLLAAVPSILKVFLGLIEIYFGIISRRNLHLGSLFISGLMMITSGIFVIFQWHKTNQNIYVIIYLIGYASIEFIWDACYLCVVEQVPTEVRGTISGACSFLSRLSGIIAANMVHVKIVWEPAPLFIAFLTAVLHFIIAYFFLDESKDANLGEVGFDLRRISKKVSQRIGQQINRLTKKGNKESNVNNVSENGI